uniref:VWFD domain-containing protein n=1 Tax=Magallana gigas TaxID=29159 RepID=A0A8W8NV44_MAGGI
MVRSFLLISLTIVLQVSANHECLSPTILGDLAKRSPNYIQDAVPLCDRYLVEDWYVAVQHKMPTIAPDLGSCGTTYPVWLNGVNSVPSNLAVAYHGVTWDTNINGTQTVHDPDINLVCQFDRLPDQSLYYDVTWYVDDTEVLTNQTVSSYSSDLALLTGSQMLAKGKKANSMVHCIVGAKLSATDIPCNTSSSPLFFAGIKVLTPTLRIVRGRSADVNIQFTIPFVNQHGIVRLPLGAILFEDQPPLLINMAVHGDSVDCNDPNKKLCEKKVYAYKREDSDKYNTDDWKGVHSIKVYNKDDGDYTIDKHITLRLETGGTSGTGSKIFDRIILPDIQVFIEDTNPSWKGSYCGSHTDPHMKTFDGKYYECQLDGTFILYRNSHFNQEVQEKHHLCYPAYSYPRCSCAVAVRSGKDVFMVDICNSKSIIHFPSCGDRVLKVIKTNDRYYKVILPTGTLVEIKFVSWPRQDNWQLNVDIFPSPSDVGNSSGLCGVLDGDYKNDFTRSDGTVDDPDNYHYWNPPNEFSESWRVTENELDLFDHDSYHSLPSISEKMDLVCTCKKHNSTAGDIECNYGTYKNCKFVVGKPFHCILNPEGQLRRKRDLRHLETMLTNSQIENKPYQEKRRKREVAPTVKNYEVAEEICSTAFQASTSYQTCHNYVTHLSNTSLINCISDVMMTGDDNFTRIHIEAALEQCSVFVVLNKTFQQTEPEVAYTIETFCQNNCSGHGICNAGNCTCNEGYAGSDCSFDLLGPPTISHISDFGFCDKSKEACDEITLFGKYFIENMNTNCFMTRHTLQEDGSCVSMAEYVVGLEERTMFEGYCPLDYDTTNHWVTEYSFNISNDGSRFTDNFHVYTYQSLCQEYRNDTGNITFIFKNGYCFINNSCVGDGSTNTINKCDICNTSKSKYDWSYNEGHCYISGICYKSGDFDGNNPCSICDPSVDKTAWSPNTGHCLIDGVCYNKNDADSTNLCSVCDPFLSTSGWSTNIKIPELTTSTSETTTSIPLSSKQPNCMKSPEDVSVEYHSVSWISTNETNTTTIRTVHQPYINFKCMFVLRQDASIFYKIKWYVNNVTLVKTVTVSEADIDQATLSSKDLPPVNHTAGLQIQCTVSASKDPASTNCKSTDSPSFFAGIKVNETYHNILRKEKVAIQVYTTIPYVTKTVVVNGQPQPLPVLGIYPLLPPSTSSCKGSIGVDKCVIEFKAYSFNERHKYDSNDWRQRQTLVLYHVDSHGYEINQYLMVQLKARLDGDRFWSNFNQNILMTITDHNEYWKGKSCGSKTDPHMYTFDGVSYENHIDGEFILYRNRLYNQEVQTRHKQCHPDYNFPYCTCAVSVQSGQDVFLVDLCGDVQFVDFLSCIDSVIQVYKISDKLYKISLPTGTYVMVSLVEWPVRGSWQIDIDIYPSLSDVNNTVGLCGTLDGDRDNDFKRRNGDTDNVNLVYPDDFSNSWKVLGDEHLLKEPLSTRQPISSTLDKICMCTLNGDQCLYNTLMHCSTTVEKQFLCTALTIQTSVSRKKRDLSGKWILPSLSVPTPLTRNRRDVQFNTSTSRENAESVCTSAFENSDPYRTCQEYVNDLSNSSLSNCINDVIMTGDYNITAIHVEAALQQCVTFVSLNTTLQNANPVVTTSIQSLCPSNCSGHGVCNKGNCSCSVGFGGSDCSFDILSPPVIWESTPSGICDKSLQQCSRVYLKGRYFLENVDKNCFFDKQSIRHDGSILAFTQLESSLEEENLFRGSCSIPSDDVTSWVTKYMFNVSYDRKQFTQSYSFYTYQSECQQHSVENGQDHFTLKKEYCFINNTCVQLAAVNPENRCQECIPGRNNYQWSGIQDCESTTTLKPSALSTSTVVYIVTASVLVFLFVVAIVVVIGVWKYRRSRQYAESSEDENTDYRRDVVSKSWMRFFDDGKFPYIPRGSRYSAETYSSSKTERFY